MPLFKAFRRVGIRRGSSNLYMTAETDVSTSPSADAMRSREPRSRLRLMVGTVRDRGFSLDCWGDAGVLTAMIITQADRKVFTGEGPLEW